MPGVRESLLEVFYGIYSRNTAQVLDALISLEIIKATGDQLSLRRSIAFFLETFDRATKEGETVGQIGEDVFAIATDQPFRFPATFTFVLRAFSTLEGIGKRLDDDYKFAVVATPYANELLELKDAGQQGRLVFQELQKEVEKRATSAADMPTNVARMTKFMEQLEAGDLKLRVRVLEAERSARRAGIMQVATLNGVAAMGFLNIGTVLFTSGNEVPATSMMVLVVVFGSKMALGFRRIKNLDRFEKRIRGG